MLFYETILFEGDVSSSLQPQCPVTLERSDRDHRAFRAPPLRGSDAAPQRLACTIHVLRLWNLNIKKPCFNLRNVKKGEKLKLSFFFHFLFL